MGAEICEVNPASGALKFNRRDLQINNEKNLNQGVILKR